MLKYTMVFDGRSLNILEAQALQEVINSNPLQERINRFFPYMEQVRATREEEQEA